jgi:ribonuclease HII
MDVGVDEVGRGSLAGPLVVGLVALGKDIPGLKDSKLLSPKQREILSSQIYAKARTTSLGWAWPHEIDQIGLTKATTLAIKRALKLIRLPVRLIILDGNYNYLDGYTNVITMINADELVPAVSAASIIAKVARDNYMRNMARYFPNYSFNIHVGYGTKAHLLAISTNGPCCLHRLSFSPFSKELNNSL